MPGKLIVIDGSDASGKHTQTEMLVMRLEAEGHDVKTLDFPQYDSFFGKMVAAYLNGEYGSLKEVGPEIASLLYALDRFSQRDRIARWLEDGNHVVLDRFTESNMGYQAAKIKDKETRERFLKWIEELEWRQLNIPKADLVMYLYVPPSISAQLIEGRDKKEYIKDAEKDIHESDPHYQERVVASYLKLCDERGWTLIECTDQEKLLTREEIAVRVWDKVSSVI